MAGAFLACAPWATLQSCMQLSLPCQVDERKREAETDHLTGGLVARLSSGILVRATSISVWTRMRTARLQPDADESGPLIAGIACGYGRNPRHSMR